MQRTTPRASAPRAQPTSTSDTLRWDDVQTFLELHRARTLGAAAKRLGVDASTASRRLAALEARIGLRLFDRSREGLTPTEHARRLAADAEAMEASARAFVRGAESLEREVEGVVRLSAPPGLADSFLVPWMNELRELHPRLVIELDARNSIADLQRREADLALRTVRPRGAELLQKRLVATRSTVLAAPRYAAELGRLRSFRTVRFLQWSGELAQLPVARWLERQPGAVIALYAPSVSTLVRAAVEGVGCVVLPRAFAAAHDLVEVSMTRSVAASLDTLPNDEVWLATHRAMRAVPRVDAVWRFLAAKLGSAEPRGEG